MKKFFLYFSITMLTILASCSDSDILSDLGGGKKIYYTTTDGKKVQFDAFSGSFDAVLVSNTYENDKGCLTFDEKVTEIGDWAFMGCENLASITIPESIVSIGESVFDSCDNLWEFRGKYASKDGRCLIIDGTLNYFAAAGLKSYNIPDGVTSIGGYAFFYCESLTSITIPDSVTSIENSTFSHCTSLTSITIPNSVTSIGNGAFYDCESLTSVYCKPTTPPSGDRWMFDNNASGRKIYVPTESVKAYKTDEWWCDYADYIVGYDFEKGEVVVNEKLLIYYTSTDGNVVTPYDTDVFGANIISNTYADGRGVITFGDDVTEIGYRAFYNCSTLANITIPDSVTEIGDYAFRDCSSLTSVTIPDSVTSIGERAFYGCSSLTSITIPDSVTSIGERAFYGCTGELIINSKIVETDYYDNPPLEGAKFSKLTIGNGVTSIGDDAFSFGESLTSITIPDSVTSIGVDAFYYCTSLTSITIPDSVTSIGNSAFDYCTSLTSITIGDSVTSIGNGAFQDCYNLASVYCKPTTPPTMGEYYGDCDAFSNNASGRKIYVPMESVEAYKTAEHWSKYANDIVGYDFE